VEKILQNYENKVNIINLGGGMDTMYFYLSEKYNNIKYIEIDCEDICYKKVTYIINIYF
jgi:hypothetical protein